MKFNERTYSYLLGLLILIYIMVQILKPAPLNWTESFSADDKIPYGGYLIYELLPEAFPAQDIRLNESPLFNFTDTTDPGQNWIFVNNRFGLDPMESKKLLDQVEKGTDLFIAARSFDQSFGDSLKLETEMENPILGGGSILDQDTTFVSFTNPQLHTVKGYPYYRSTTETYITSIDSSLNVKVLGRNGDGKTNFIQVSWGEGNIYLHSNPTLFTNYFVRDPYGAEYAFKALSYLPYRTTYWDEYYKDINRSNFSVLSYVVSEEHLKWAWFTALWGIILFMIFRAKRKQRVIPVIQPPTNSSLEFAHTIGNLYLEKGDHKSIIEKKIHFFFDYIRSHLALETLDKDDSFMEQVSKRSGVEFNEIKDLFHRIQTVQKQDEISIKELKTVTQKIDHFYKQSQR